MGDDLKDWGKRHSTLIISASALLTVAAFVGLFVLAPWWLDGARLRALGHTDVAMQHNALDKDRSQVLKIAAGLGAVVALVYTARKHLLDREAHSLNQQSHLTDRYVRAVDQLGSTSTDVRLGGIYALGRLMADSDRDRLASAEVLAAYLRHHSPVDVQIARQTRPEKQPVPIDMVAALTVLARGEALSERPDLDLRYTDISGIEVLGGSGLSRANIGGGNLSRVNWVGLTLAHVNLWQANLRRAGLLTCDLTDASLGEADLTEAVLHASTFKGAWMADAVLDKANLINADLSLARGLTAEQLSTAGIASSTRLPSGLIDDPWIVARLADCASWAGGWFWDSTKHPVPAATSRPNPVVDP